MKLCVIGGGSTYTPELIDGLLRRRDRLPIERVHLVDVDDERLAVLGPLAQRMADAAGAQWDVRWGTDRVAGIRDSAFVVSQMRVGGMAARERDEQLGREFGLIGQETVGVGGFANALRTIPVALDIARDIAEHACGAVLLNFTNPAGLVTEALCRHSEVTTIGLCNVPWSFSQWFAGALNVDATDLELDYVGLNHLSWVRRVRTPDGTDHVRTLVDGMAGHAERHPPKAGSEPGWTADIVRLIDAIPNYYLLYYFETAAWERHQATHPTRASEVMAIEQALLDQYRNPELTTKPKELEQRGGAYYSETAAALMADIASDAGTVHVVNVRNDGAIPGLPDDVVVEVPARVNRAGARAIPTAPLRADVDALVRTVKDFELLTVRAAVDGDEDAARLALLTNPLGPGASNVSAVWHRLQDVHAGFLGRLERR